MTSRFRRSFVFPFSTVVLAALALILTGCVATGASTDSSDAPSEVTGTWTYRASGAQPLSQGTLQLATTNGRLTGRLRDSELGTIPLDVRVSGERLELRMEVFRIGLLSVAGSVQGDEFHGLVDRPVYNVTMSANEAPGRRHALHGSFRAERRGVPTVPELVLNCPRLGPDGVQSCR